jgi:hypothetical protein
MRYDYEMEKYSDYYGGDTMGRIIIAGGESKTKIGFYDLYEVEGRKIINKDNNIGNGGNVGNSASDKNNKKDYYQMLLNYTQLNINIQDNYMTKDVFDYLIKKMQVYKDDNKNNSNNTDTNINQLKGEVIFLPINQRSRFIENINCYTSKFYYSL